MHETSHMNRKQTNNATADYNTALAADTYPEVGEETFPCKFLVHLKIAKTD